jgi:hypothetical protein
MDDSNATANQQLDLILVAVAQQPPGGSDRLQGCAAETPRHPRRYGLAIVVVPIVGAGDAPLLADL